MKTIKIILYTCLLFVFTQCGHKTPEQKIDYFADKISCYLDFSKEQKDILAKITDDLKKDIPEEKSFHKSQAQEFEQILNAQELDKQKLKNAFQQSTQRMNAKLEKNLDKLAELHKTFTPKQKEQIQSFMKKMNEEWE